MPRPSIWDQLEVHYQPTFRLVDGRPVGVEALLRWRHPTFGLLPAARFLPTLQRDSGRGLICRFVLDRALGALPQLRRNLMAPGLRIGVNLWTQEIVGGGALEELEDALSRRGVEAEAVVVELTHQALDDDDVTTALRGMIELGVGVCLDDFGRAQTAGFAALGRVTLDQVKIDHGLVADLEEGGAARRVVAAVVCMANDLGIATVAEGVERPFQVALLQQMGVHAAQGRLFAPPLPVL